MKRAAALGPLLLLTPLPALAQQDDAQLWLQANASAEVADGAQVTLEAIARFSDRAGGYYHQQFGVLGAYEIADGIEVAAGYRHLQEYDHGRASPDEERFRQIVTAELSKHVAARLRVEERLQRGGTEMAVRVRPQLRLSFPLGGSGLKLLASQEHFFNLNTTGWGVRSGYERMRNAIGLSFPLSAKLRGEAGYLNQYRFGRSGARGQIDHIATLTLSLSLDGIFSRHGGDTD